MMEKIGADRIALGSDYPFPLGEPLPGELITSLDNVDAETRVQMLSGTAIDFLRLDRGRFRN